MKKSTVVDLTGAEVSQILTKHAREKANGKVSVDPAFPKAQKEGEKEAWNGMDVRITLDRNTVIQVLKDHAGENLKSEERTGTSEVELKLTANGIEGASIRFHGVK